MDHRLYLTYHGGTTLPNATKGQIEDVLLETHPLGVLSKPKFNAPWPGTAEECVKQCHVLRKEVKAVLQAFFSKSLEIFPPEDLVSAIEETVRSKDSVKHHLVIVLAQRLVWNRAKELWPTIQYQYKLFSELTRSLSHFLVTVFSKAQSAPDSIANVLNNQVPILRRLAFQVRFVYHELRDLGVLLKKFYSALPRGWDRPGHQLSALELAQAAGIIQEWCKQSTELIAYHEDSRFNTWINGKIDVDKHEVPLGVWFKFGNPPNWKEFEDMRGEPL